MILDIYPVPPLPLDRDSHFTAGMHPRTPEMTCRHLSLPLHLVVPLYALLICGRRHRLTLSRAAAFSTLLLVLSRRRRRRYRSIAPLCLRLRMALLRRLLLNVVVGHAATLGVLREFFVCGVGVGGDDVPGVNQTRKIAKAAKADIDERVRGADAALDPDCGALVLQRG